MTTRFSVDNRLPADHYQAGLRADVLHGFATEPRTLSPKWFYDKRGSSLFEQITELPEYYLTRAEYEILDARADEIAAASGARTMVELGSGYSRKTRLLLEALTAVGTLERYVPLDVSPSALTEAGDSLCDEFPKLQVAAIVADFEGELRLEADDPAPRMLAFLGSTIGNLDPAQRQDLYARLHRALNPGDSLLLGADLVKDASVLLPAYNDAQGVTEAFNKNVLSVINRELDADFDLAAFEHRAIWNAEEERIEMWLRSRVRQNVKIRALDLVVDFAAGEEVRTELSCKFRRDKLTAELAAGGFAVRSWWTDEAERFALLLAEPVR